VIVFPLGEFGKLLAMALSTFCFIGQDCFLVVICFFVGIAVAHITGYPYL